MDIPIPSERVATIAAGVSSSRKTAAALVILAALLFGIGIVGVAYDGGSGDQSRGSLIGGMAFWLAVLALLGRWFWTKAARATQLGQLAADPTWTLVLDDRTIVPVDGNGVRRLDKSFKVSARQCAVLVAAPRAQVVTQPPASTRSPS